MINMAFMPLYMWEMWDVTPVTHRHTDGGTDGQWESRAVFSLSWIRNTINANVIKKMRLQEYLANETMKMENNVEDDDDGGGRYWPSGQKCNSCKQSADQGSPIQPLGTWRSRCDVRWEITFDCILSMPITISNIWYTNSATWDILYCQLVLETDFQDEGSRWIKHLDFATSVFLSEWKLISLPPLVCCPW